jgi:hypothetical protein
MAALAALAIPSLALSSSAARAADEPACQQSAGAEQSAAYVAQCLLVATDNAATCVATKPCAAIVGEIKRGCSAIRQSLQGHPAVPAEEGGEPAFCKAQLGN